MAAVQKQKEPQNPAIESAVLPGLTRVFWTLLGPLLLVGTITHNAVSPAGWLSGWDIAVALIAAAMIACRWREQRASNPQTAYGEPSTPQHFRRYTLTLVIAAGIAWALANVLGNQILS